MKQKKIRQDNTPAKAAKSRLTRRIPAILCAVVALIVFVMCLAFEILSNRVVTELVNREVEYVAQQNAQTAKSYLQGMNIYAQALSKETLHFRGFGQETTEDLLIGALKDAVGSGQVFSAYFAFEPNLYLEDTPEGLSYYAYQSDSGINVDVFNDYAVYRDGDYYAVSRDTKQIHVTEPYSYDLTNGQTVWLITLSVPILDESGRFLGVANCDILSESINNLDYSHGAYTQAYSAILTSPGTYVAHTKDAAVVGSTAGDKDFAAALEGLRTGAKVTKTINDPYAGGQKAFAIYESIALEGTDLHWVSTFTVVQTETLAPVRRIITALSVAGAIGVIALTVFCLILIRSALAPITPLLQLAQKIRRFDLSEQGAAQTFPSNELGELAAVFLGVAEDLRQVVSDQHRMLGAMAEGDFSVESGCEERYVGELRDILVSMQNIALTLGSTLGKINLSSDMVSAEADQVSGGAQALAQGATEQAASIEELTSMLGEISSNISENAKNAGVAGALSAETSESAARSNALMGRMTESMSNIAEVSGEIQKINNVIDNIAFQTNILALNASVEAARAGTAGKGFAVVADEVRNLALKSAEAAKNTADLIEQTVHAVREGSSIAEETAASLRELAEKNQNANHMIQSIATATEHEAELVEQVLVGIEQISTVVQVNTATAEESAAASHQLSSQAKNLKGLVGVFHLSKQR